MAETFVVTGATSFIGEHLLQCLSRTSAHIYAAVRAGSRHIGRLKQFRHIEILPYDLMDMDSLSKQIPDRIDVFYHLAWDGTRRPYRDHEELQCRNYQAALQAYMLAKGKGCHTFIGAGSQAEYGKTAGNITEEYPERPTTMYGKYKLRAGKELVAKGRQDGISVIWPRIFSIYGKDDDPNTLIMSAIRNLLKDEKLELTECKQNWNYLYVKDAARMLFLLGDNMCEAGVYNLAGNDNRPLMDYVLEMKSLTQSSSVLDFGAVPYGAEGMVSFQPDIRKFLTYFPTFKFESFSSGIREMLADETV